MVYCKKRKTSWRHENRVGFPIFLESPQALKNKARRGHYILDEYVMGVKKILSTVPIRGGFPKPPSEPSVSAASQTQSRM